MSRPRGSKNKTDSDGLIIDMVEEQTTEEQKAEEPLQEVEERTVSIFEASERLKTTESTIKIWVAHGHLTSINGRIPIRSIRECRFNTRRFV